MTNRIVNHTSVSDSAIQWNLRQGTLRDRDDLCTKVELNANYYSVLFDLRDRDDLSTRDKIVGPIIYIPSL